MSVGFFCSVKASSGEICNRVVAIVNDEVITLYELNGKMKEVTGQEPDLMRRQNEERYLEARRKILDLLIDEKISQEKAVELGIDVDPQEIDAAVERMKRKNGFTHEDLLEGLRKRGINYDKFRANLKKEIQMMKLIGYEVKSKIVIREKEIEEYYNQHKDQFRVKERVRLASIFLTPEDPNDSGQIRALQSKAEEIVSVLRKGEDFGEMAKRVSQGPGAQDGGDLGFFELAQLDPELTKTIGRISVGGISDPIVRPAGVQIIKVLEKNEGGISPLETVRKDIFDVLYRGEVDKRYASWIKELREKAYTKIIF
jgi:peptidyl-prolyl cis-trans isomerase SurA